MGYLADGETCVPENCGMGTWGDLPVDSATVYVSADAAERGDGTEGAPLASIQAGMDLAGSRGGGLVAVAAGRYPETLALTSDHAGVHLAGRCRELVTLDASEGDVDTPGIDIDVRYGEVEVSGASVAGSMYRGVRVASGSVRLVGLRVVGNDATGVQVYRGTATAPSIVRLDGCELSENSPVGVLAYHSSTEVTLVDTAIRDTRPDENGNFGYGIQVYGGAVLRTENSELVGNMAIGLAAGEANTEITLVDTAIRGTVLGDHGRCGYGVQVTDGAVLRAEGCELAGNALLGGLVADPGTKVTLADTTIRGATPGGAAGHWHGVEVVNGAAFRAVGSALVCISSLGIAATDTGTEVVLVDTSIRDTQPGEDGSGGYGIQVNGGAVLFTEGCELARNTAVGLVAAEPGTETTLVDTVVRDTAPNEDGESGYGIQIDSGAALRADRCALVANTAVGLAAADSGTMITLVDTSIRDTLRGGQGGNGYGIQVHGGAALSVEGCELANNTAVGILVSEPGTEVELVDTSIRHTRPDGLGEGGYGILADFGASLRAEGCEVTGNTTVGILAGQPGTGIAIHDSSISGTVPGYGSQGATSVGLVAQQGATVSASGTHVWANEGPGLLSWFDGARLHCDDCTLFDNAFAGACALHGSALEIRGSTISGSRQSADLGGGVGIHAAQPKGMDPAHLLIADSIISDNLVAGAWLEGAGSYRLEGVTLTGGIGVPHGSTTRCGDGVYAAGVSAWDGSAGLSIERSTLTSNQGAGLFLDDASALIGGNTWSDNDTDLLVQGEACLSPPADWAEAPSSEICPTWDRPACEQLFRLDLDIAEMDPARPTTTALFPTLLPTMLEPILPSTQHPPSPRMEPPGLEARPAPVASATL